MSFAGGYKPRKVLIAKLLDLTYQIGLRIGEDMARSNLTGLCSAFFSAFDKVYTQEAVLIKSEYGGDQDAISELAEVLTPEFAYSCYVAFCHLMGRAHLDLSMPNLDLVKKLCLMHPQQPFLVATFAHLRLTSSQDFSSASSGGNKILASQDSGTVDEASNGVHSLIKKEARNQTRHLKGNWLAYWEHEIGRSEKDVAFNMKQIKLQTFQGHGAGIKCLHILDNENSFLSGSRDKTVKVWSMRSQGDGSAALNAQWTYTLHKKSVTNVSFVSSLSLAASNDSTIHIWDPFVGTGVYQVLRKIIFILSRFNHFLFRLILLAWGL